MTDGEEATMRTMTRTQVLIALCCFTLAGCGPSARQRDSRIAKEASDLQALLDNPANQDATWYRDQCRVETDRWDGGLFHGHQGKAFVSSPHERMWWFLLVGYGLVGAVLGGVVGFAAKGSP